ncbi:tectonin beta-propeller repeat-containing protein 1-like [Asterias rubens]|uniref:tectonin beta-propeller repeat-containing protein 1-like n=1 Tax=Asterias rubens TaxID=7604 RepID=UPI001455CB38|nr:tectonin beta-propeller repeat-containing protein 1-like [Asterias rubens]
MVLMVMQGAVPNSAERLNTCNGGDWRSIDSRSLKHVSVGPAGVWGVDNNYDIYYRVGTYDNETNTGDSWVTIGGSDQYPLAGGLSQVAVGRDAVWGFNRYGALYFRLGITACKPEGTAWTAVPGTFGDPDSDTDGDGWTNVDGLLKYISSSDTIYGVSTDDAIFYRQGVSAGTPTGTEWQIIPGALKQVESLSLAVWGVNAANEVFVKETD